MVKKMSTSEANIEMNKRLDDGDVHVMDGKGQKSVEEANMALERAFYSNTQTGIAPMYAINSAAIRISGDDDRDEEELKR